LIDIHSHVLWGLDDGAKTLEDAVAMAEMAAASGTTDLVATPHASPRYKYDPELVRNRAAELETAIGERSAGRPAENLRLHIGCDFHLSYDNIQDALANPTKYTINNSRYLLVEFSDLLIFRNTAEIFERMLGEGMVPIITHPERNPLLRQRIDEMAVWVDAGAYVQVTAQSLTGHFGKRAQETSHALLRRGLVHFLASDAHDLMRRPPRLNEAHEVVVKTYGPELAELLCIRNPRAVLTGESIELPEVGALKNPRKWYQIWR
jgi:protein-tyrosine phosphatase